MPHHQRLYGGVGRATPITTGEKGPADLDLAGLGTCGIKARRADQGVSRRIDSDQGAVAGQSIREEASEDRFLPTIMRRVDGPDQRVARDRVERFPIIRVQRAQLNEGMQE